MQEDIAKDVKESLTKCMTGFGFLIIQALVNDIAPAQKVREAMNEINAAQRLRLSAYEKAEAQKVSSVANSVTCCATAFSGLFKDSDAAFTLLLVGATDNEVMMLIW